MPEFTWTAALTWFGVIAGAQCVAVLVTGLVSRWQTRHLQAEIDAVMQTTRADIAQSFREGQQHLSQILARMDRRPETLGEGG